VVWSSERTILSTAWATRGGKSLCIYVGTEVLQRVGWLHRPEQSEGFLGQWSGD
jgi:hypothetical protein